MTLEQLVAAGFDVTPETHRRLARFVELLLRENSRVNLTAIRTAEDAWPLHICESLALLPLMESLRPRALLDLGTGGGIPGIPLACARPELDVTLLDATRKKLRAVERILTELQLNERARRRDRQFETESPRRSEPEARARARKSRPERRPEAPRSDFGFCNGSHAAHSPLSSVRTLWGRAEQRAHDAAYRERFDAVVARAVASLPTLVEYAAGFVRVGGRCWFPKSAEAARQEVEAARGSAEQCGLTHVGTHPFTLPAGHGERAVVVYEKRETLSADLPRPPGRARRKPL